MLGMIMYDGEDEPQCGEYNHSFQRLHQTTKEILSKISSSLENVEVAGNPAFKFLSAAMKMLNLMSEFFKVTWKLPHRTDRTTIKHNEDVTAKEKYEELMTTAEKLFAKLVLDGRCKGSVKNAMLSSIKKVASALSEDDTPIQPFVELLERQWDPASPIGAL